jgi:hypothetical protein
MPILAFHSGEVASQAAEDLGLPPRWGCRIFGWWTLPHRLRSGLTSVAPPALWIDEVRWADMILG